jgi:hypothetical protein
MADLYEVADLRLSLSDMTKKPLLGAAPQIEILKRAKLHHPEGCRHRHCRRLGVRQIHAGPGAGAASGTLGRGDPL